jgi:hypothetical protein
VSGPSRYPDEVVCVRSSWGRHVPTNRLVGGTFSSVFRYPGYRVPTNTHLKGMFGTALLQPFQLCSINSIMKQLHSGVTEFFYVLDIAPPLWLWDFGGNCLKWPFEWCINISNIVYAFYRYQQNKPWIKWYFIILYMFININKIKPGTITYILGYQFVILLLVPTKFVILWGFLSRNMSKYFCATWAAAKTKFQNYLCWSCNCTHLGSWLWWLLLCSWIISWSLI